MSEDSEQISPGDFMFILTTFSDLVQIPPHEFYKRDGDEVEDKIHEKYSNKVVQKIGLCIAMYDLLKASDGLIGHGTGNVNVNVEFRMIVFRPFKGEVILGKIAAQDKDGIRISTEFFDDIYVPANMLFPNTNFDNTTKLWVWSNEEMGDYVFELGDPTRVRIEAETWEDQAPSGPTKPALPPTMPQKAVVNGEVEEPRKVPYSITASMAEGGLGPVQWW